MTKIDLSKHIKAFQTSSRSAVAYCAGAGINLGTFRYHLYKQKKGSRYQRPKRFQEFQIATELVIMRDHHGSLSLSGFDVSHLPQIIGAWSNALSQ